MFGLEELKSHDAPTGANLSAAAYSRMANSFGQWCLLVIAMSLFCAATGRLTAKTVPDTDSYLHYPFHSLDAALRSIRTPGYPVLLQCVDKSIGVKFMPLIHLLLQATAAWMLIGELKRWGTPLIPSWAAGLAIALSCTSLDNLSIIATDAPAAALGVMAAVSLMAWVRTRQSLSAMFAVVFCCSMAIAMRPAYLALVPWVFIAGTCLLYQTKAGSLLRSIGSALLLSTIVMVPIIAWIFLRGAMVNDFSILPFGHQNLAGITVQLVTDEELLATTGPPHALAKEILATKAEIEAQGFQLASGQLGAAMTMENRWDDYVWKIIVPAATRLYPDDSIASHEAIAALNETIISRYPMRYLKWVMLALRRAVWGTFANIAMHPIFLLLIGFATLWKLTRLIIDQSAPSPVNDKGLNCLFVISVTYFIAHVGLIILTSPPLGRFADAAAIFIPAWFLANWIQSMNLHVKA